MSAVRIVPKVLREPAGKQQCGGYGMQAATLELGWESQPGMAAGMWRPPHAGPRGVFCSLLTASAQTQTYGVWPYTPIWLVGPVGA
jgi:hypothetical protein